MSGLTIEPADPVTEAAVPQEKEAITPLTGRVVQVLGAVIDVEFPADHLPGIYQAIEVRISGQKEPLVAEVQQHLGHNRVRSVAMGSTDGLERGAEVVNTAQPISVPVGEGTLGRIFNILGQPIDLKGPAQTTETRPIHHPPRLSRTNPSEPKCLKPA